MKKTSTLKKQMAALFAVFLLGVTGAFAQTYHTFPAFNGTSNVYKGPSTAFVLTPPDTSARVQRTAAIYPASEVNTIPAGTPVTSIGFRIDSAAATAATGNIKIYMSNTTNTTFTASTTWNTLIGGMTLVYNGPLTIPAAKGFYDITLTTPFNYTGGGIYMAFDWDISTKTVFDAIYAANNSLAGSAKFSIGTRANPPASLPNSSAFRPVIRLAYTAPANDAGVIAVRGLGQMPQVAAANPQPISAVVVNRGTGAITNKVVTLTIKGANSFTTTSTIASLASGDSATVNFTGYTPTNTGIDSVIVSVPADDVNGNNRASYIARVTRNMIGYVTSPLIANSAAGITGSTPGSAGQGAFLTKYTVSGTTPVRVDTVSVFLGNGASTSTSTLIGKTVFAVVLNSAGVKIGRSANLVISTADVDNFYHFAIPNAPTLTSGDFYVGLAVTSGPIAYYAVGTQPEPIIRRGAYYAVLGDTTFSGSTAPIDIAPIVNLGRFMITATLNSPTGVNKEVLSDNAVIVYPNPSAGNVNILLNGINAKTVAVEVRNLQGQVVYKANVAADNKISMNLDYLAAGIYTMHIDTETQSAVRKLVIE